MAEPRFGVGETVRFLSDRSRIGQVTGEARRVGGVCWYGVRMADGELLRAPEDDLEPFLPNLSPQERFARGSFGDHEDLVRLITWHKLSQPLDNALYSLGATRTTFYPHQFKPLLKFLEAGDQRLLIADEVGLGKTIEAGLVMAELRARDQLREVLVVCPKALCDKWREEMWRRFDEEFQVLDSSGFREAIRRFREQDALGRMRAIVSLQSLRQASVIEDLEGTPLPLDLVIVDEAHHLRNSETLSHRAVRAAIEGATGVLFLTATPIHLGSENLFSLFRLLKPGSFDSLWAFDQAMAANEPVIEAERIAAARFPPDMGALAERFDTMLRGRHRQFFAGNPLVERWSRWAEQAGNVRRPDVARLSSDLKQINLFSHIFTRTRKREVFESARQRRAAVLAPEITGAERRFYESVTDFVRHVHGEGSTAAFFAAVTAQRQVASCMPAARARFVERAFDWLADDGDPEDVWADDDVTGGRLDPPRELLAAAEAMGGVDSKFDKLLETIRAIDEEEAGRKILIFSYFRDTLSYLHGRLREAGYVCDVIHGGVPTDPGRPETDQRGAVIRRFRDDPRVRFLLSSEVGGEGLDFQFCHIMVNYDLPWNPMKVEQRIGRLDRLGQDAPAILIFNFTLPGTIEQRILERLHDRIGIFVRSIGDLEMILGNQIQEMTRELLSRRLTPEEEERIIDRAADVIENNREHLERLERGADQFVGRDAYFEEQLERARTGGQTLTPGDIKTFLTRFIDRYYPDSTVAPTRTPGVFRLEVDRNLESAVRALPENLGRLRFLHALNSGNGIVRMTFDADHTFGADDIELVAAPHPLVRLAVEHYRDHKDEFVKASAVTVEASGDAMAGTYIYRIEEVVTTMGSTRGVAGTRRRLEPFFVTIEDGQALEESTSSRLFGTMLRNGRPWSDAVTDLATGTLGELIEAAGWLFIERMSAWRNDAEERAVARLHARTASLRTAHDARIRRLDELIAREAAGAARKTYLQLLGGQRRARVAEFESKLTELEGQGVVSMTTNLVGCGLLRAVAE